MSDGIIRHGIHQPLEDAANEILRVALSTVTRHSDKSDVLTPWKEQDRRKREVYVSTGTPDGALRRGISHRVLNPGKPHLNSVEGQIPRKQGFPSDTSPWDQE